MSDVLWIRHSIIICLLNSIIVLLTNREINLDILLESSASTIKAGSITVTFCVVSWSIAKR